MILDAKKKNSTRWTIVQIATNTRLQFRRLRVTDSRHSENVLAKNCYLCRGMPLPLSVPTVLRRTLYVVRTKIDRLKISIEYRRRPLVRIVHFHVEPKFNDLLPHQFVETSSFTNHSILQTTLHIAPDLEHRVFHQLPCFLWSESEGMILLRTHFLTTSTSKKKKKCCKDCR